MKQSFLSFLIAFLLTCIARAEVAVPPVILTEQGVKNLGLETVPVEEADFETTTFALGRTEAIPDQRSVLSSRASGRVIETNLNIGTYVEKNDTLVLLESRQPGIRHPASGSRHRHPAPSFQSIQDWARQLSLHKFWRRSRT